MTERRNEDASQNEWSGKLNALKELVTGLETKVVQSERRLAQQLTEQSRSDSLRVEHNMMDAIEKLKESIFETRAEAQDEAAAVEAASAQGKAAVAAVVAAVWEAATKEAVAGAKEAATNAVQDSAAREAYAPPSRPAQSQLAEVGPRPRDGRAARAIKPS